MSKKRYSVNDVIDSGVLQRVLTLRQPELLILRGHGLVEAALHSILAARLGVKVDELPTSTFDLLARLALSGSRYGLMLGPVLHINRIRNVVAHELKAADAEVLMAEFVATMPPSLANPAKRAYDMSVTEAFAASLMVIIYALLQLNVAPSTSD